VRIDAFRVASLYLWAGAIAIRAAYGDTLPGFRPAPRFGEQVLTGTLAGDVRFSINAATSFDPKLPTLVVFYATPNGNSMEETLGRRPKSAAEWRFDIQHVAAQIRLLRSLPTRHSGWFVGSGSAVY
jgi:hypothetical protein